MGEEEGRGETGAVVKEHPWEAVKNRLNGFYFPGLGSSLQFIARR